MRRGRNEQSFRFRLTSLLSEITHNITVRRHQAEVGGFSFSTWMPLFAESLRLHLCLVVIGERDVDNHGSPIMPCIPLRRRGYSLHSSISLEDSQLDIIVDKHLAKFRSKYSRTYESQVQARVVVYGSEMVSQMCASHPQWVTATSIS